MKEIEEKEPSESSDEIYEFEAYYLEGAYYRESYIFYNDEFLAFKSSKMSLFESHETRNNSACQFLISKSEKFFYILDLNEIKRVDF